ncbi:MAG: ComEA family DNA-binding protein [Planctomycetota bacterium]
MVFPLAPRPDPIPRRRRARGVLDLILLAGALVVAGRGFARALAPPPPFEPPLPMVVDLRRDPAGRLALLPGIGPVRAKAIVEDRRRHGPVPTLEALVRVPGIGPGTVERLRRAEGVRVRPRATLEPGQERARTIGP